MFMLLSLFIVTSGSLARAGVSSGLTSTFGTPTVTVSTSIPSPTRPLNATLPSQANLPPTQAWCPSNIFCAGQVRVYSIYLIEA